MVSDNFYQGYMQQRAINANNEIRNANILLRQLREQRDADADEIADLRRQLKDASHANQVWNAHYLALEAQRDYLLGLLDKAHGPDSNPARKAAYKDDVDVRIPGGPRAGERVTMRDHIFFSRLAELTKAKFSALGSWKELLRKNNIFE